MIFGEESGFLFTKIREYTTEFLPKQKGVSPNTIISYKHTLDDYLIFTARELNVGFFENTFDSFDAKYIEKYLLNLEENRDNSARTRNIRLAAIRGFLKHATSRDSALAIYYIKAIDIPTKKIIQPPIEVFSEEALSLILEQPDTKTKIGIRDKTFMILLYDTAARVQELLDVKLRDLSLDSNDRTIVLTGKGNETRLVPLMNSTKQHVLKYNSIFHKSNDMNQYLFYTKWRGETGKMSRDTVEKFVSKYAKQAREKSTIVPEHIYPHMFRHSRATHLYRGGMPLPLVAEWLGHKKVDTTKDFYADANIEMKRSAIEKATSKFNPLLQSKIDYTYSKADEEDIKRMFGLI